MLSQTIMVLRIMTIVKYSEVMGTPLDIAQSYKNTPMFQTQSIVNYVGHLLMPNNVMLWMLLQTNYISFHSGLMKFLKDLEEDVDVVEVSEVGELEEEGQLNVIIVMSRDISLDIFLF
jgi:hypothetical protein